MNIVLTLADDRSIVESLRAALPQTDLLLFENTVQDALRRLIAMRADVVILDDAAALGLEALKDLTEAVPNTPVIVLSSTSTPESLGTYKMAGARECVPKPFKCEDLELAIRRCIGDHNADTRRIEDPSPRPDPSRALTQHQMALRWMSRVTTHFDDTARLVQSLVDALMDIFDPARACVLLLSNGDVRVTAFEGISAAVAKNVRLDFNAGLMRRIEASASLVSLDQPSIDADTEKEMRVLGGRVAVPLTSLGRVCGVIVIGEKTSGADYSGEERELLALVARCVSACLDRACRYRDVTRQQNRLDAVVANITAGVVTVAPDKTVTMMNESAERILQLRAADILGRSVQKLGSSFADVVLRALDEGRPRLRHQIRDVAIGATLGLSVTPLGPEGAVAIFSILPEDESAKDVVFSPIWKFLSNRVAQEIKNPMVAISTFAQLLPKKYESNEFRDEFAVVVQNEVERINDVVEALYAFAGHARLTLERIKLNDHVSGILERFDADLKAQRIKLETHFDHGDTVVNIDQGQFAQAVENVIQNCIDAMPKGGILKVSTRRENGACELIIGDTGAGITEQDAPLIFTPFFSTKEKGMGLGLTMASRILREHDGNLRLTSDPDGGGSFVFNLPYAQADESHRPNDA